MKNRIIKLVLGALTGVMMFGMTAFAAEGVTVADTNAVLYTASGADLLMDADSNATVALADLQAGLPIQVTGITSNGFFRIALNGQTFYVEGTGLVQTAGTATVASTAATTASAVKNADGTVPVKDANGNYVCVIEDTDYLICREVMGRENANPKRVDYTQNPVYIACRNELESEIAAGSKDIDTEWFGLSLGKEVQQVLINLMIDVCKSHPEFNDANVGVNGFTGNYGMDNPFNGQSEANYWLYLSQSEKSRLQITNEADALIQAAFATWG